MISMEGQHVGRQRRRILRWREIANLWRASAGPMVLPELVIGSLRREARDGGGGSRISATSRNGSPPFPIWRMRCAHVLQFMASYGPRFCNRHYS